MPAIRKAAALPAVNDPAVSPPRVSPSTNFDPPQTASAAAPPEHSDGAAEREQRIREAAYYRYLQRCEGAGDAPGDAVEDWLSSEAEIDSVEGIDAQRAPAQ